MKNSKTEYQQVADFLADEYFDILTVRIRQDPVDAIPDCVDDTRQWLQRDCIEAVVVTILFNCFQELTAQGVLCVARQG